MFIVYEVIDKGSIFKWGDILSVNIVGVVNRSINYPKDQKVCFLMSTTTYLMDIVCAMNQFTGFAWHWTPIELPLHTYCSDVWEYSYMKHFTHICDHFMIPLYSLVFKKSTSKIIEESKEVIAPFGD